MGRGKMENVSFRPSDKAEEAINLLVKQGKAKNKTEAVNQLIEQGLSRSEQPPTGTIIYKEVPMDWISEEDRRITKTLIREGLLEKDQWSED